MTEKAPSSSRMFVDAEKLGEAGLPASFNGLASFSELFRSSNAPRGQPSVSIFSQFSVELGDYCRQKYSFRLCRVRVCLMTRSKSSGNLEKASELF